jgi:ribosomal protein L3
MKIGLLGRKLGMTRVYDDNGKGHARYCNRSRK